MGIRCAGAVKMKHHLANTVIARMENGGAEKALFRQWWRGDDADLELEEAWRRWNYVKGQTYGGRVENDEVRGECANGAPPDFVVWPHQADNEDESALLEFINGDFTLVDGTVVSKEEFFETLLKTTTPKSYHIHTGVSDYESSTLIEVYC